MITRDDLINSMLHEINVAKFIAGKIPVDRWGWRPSPKQRSVIELAQYLTRAGIGSLKVHVNGNRDHAEAMIAKANSVTPLTFARAMDDQAAEIKRVLGALGHGRLANDRVTLPIGGPPQSLAAAILNSSLKYLTAYRMQLFMYAKQLSREELGTAQAWAGRDPAPTAK